MSTTTASTTPSGTSLRNRLSAIDWRQNIIYIGFVVVFVFFAITLGGDGFLTPNNLLNILRQTATITVMAVAMTFVIASAEIDLSIGATAGLASVVTAMTLSEYGMVLGIAAGLAVGFTVGAINGALVARLGIPSFLVTLGMLGIVSGVAMWITDSAPQPILNDVFNSMFGSGNVGPIPGLFFWSATFVIVGWIVMRKTKYGRFVLATGGNRQSADFTGINTAKVKFRVLVACSVAAAIAGMLYAGRLQSGRFQWGTGDELSAIAAVILGGTSLFGGTGYIVGTLFGALLIGLINNGLILIGLDVSQQMIVRGAIIILAVALARKK